MERKTDFLVIGSGIAGLTFALRVAPYGRVTIVTKREVMESNTRYAQGGIASVWSQEDSFSKHISDTLVAGDGLCNEEIVEMTVKEGPGRIRDLIKWGVDFSVWEKDVKKYDLTKEGGHSRRRILHASDLTGEAVERTLVKRVRKNRHITVCENFFAVKLIVKHDVCWGAYVLDVKKSVVHTFLSKVTLLATGGAGKVYLYTSNPGVATGDGIAMAHRAGAKIANMEFIQFHPTCLYHPRAKTFLISEAVRGEGAVLRLRNGRTFMEHYHPQKDLAPRDIVARAIDREIKKTGDDCVFLDITAKGRDFIRTRFPNIYGKCLSFGIDMTREPIPVVPAAHYLCGGVLVNKEGQTSLKRLYAAGEVACTGFNGANRLASNSLLEALVFAQKAAEKSLSDIKGKARFPSVSGWDKGYAVDAYESVLIAHNWDEIRRIMWDYVGIVRSNKRLLQAKQRIRMITDETNKYYWDFIVTCDLLELRNIITVADLIVRSAIMRKESRGLHYNIDYPRKDNGNWKKDTIL